MRLKWWSCALFAALFLSFSAGAQARDQQLLQHLEQLQESGQLPSQATLRIKVKQGNRAAFLGRNHQLRRQWEEATGILLDIGLMPQEPAKQHLKQNPGVDLIVARNSEYPDLYDQQLVLPLDPLLEALELPFHDDQDFFLKAAQTQFAGNTLAIPADGDLLLLYLRQDLLEDKQEQQAFYEGYGYALAAPETWQEYRDQLEFFHRPEEHFYGSVELRDRDVAWMYWLPRFAAQSYPNQLLFDDQMNPLVNTPEGWQATQSYLDTVKFSPEAVHQPGSGYNAALPYFNRGQAYSMLITVAGAKLFNREPELKHQYSVYPLPGIRHPQGLNRRTTLAYGNHLVIPSTSQQPELALLYALWFTSPSVSTEAISLSSSFVDPFRYSHFEQRPLQQVYGTQALEALQTSLPLAAPAGTGLPGNSAYLQALNLALGEAVQGKLSAQEAMAQVEQEWQAITEDQGRDRQQAFWEAQTRLYPEQHKERLSE